MAEESKQETDFDRRERELAEDREEVRDLEADDQRKGVDRG